MSSFSRLAMSSICFASPDSSIRRQRWPRVRASRIGLDNAPKPNARFKAAMKLYQKAKRAEAQGPNADRSFNWQP